MWRGGLGACCFVGSILSRGERREGVQEILGGDLVLALLDGIG